MNRRLSLEIQRRSSTCNSKRSLSDASANFEDLRKNFFKNVQMIIENSSRNFDINQLNNEVCA